MPTDNKNTVTYLKDYQVPEFIFQSVNLEVDLHEEQTIVTAIITCTKNPLSQASKEHLTLVGRELTLLELKLNDQVLAAAGYNCTESHLTIYNVPEKFTLEIKTKIFPQKNTALVGLYKSKNMYCTQCEAEGFRSITYYLDRPDVMAKFTTTIRAEKKSYPVLLANGNLIATSDLGNGRHMATWEDPFPKPCYLFAMVAGSLAAAEDHFLTKSGRIVKIKIYVELENLAQTTHALKAVKKAMLWDEINYGREYDLDIYMIVAVSDFNMGAMENKGLNIFNTKYILASPQTATDEDFENIDAVVAHEYFHNWSGNRVTCRDWFQLSLKEGFTVFREQQFTRDVTESPISRIDQYKTLSNRQFTEDSGPLAHPVRPQSYIAIDNFYTMTVYEKGAEVVRMLSVILGKEKFRRATDLYFTRHDGMAATVEDFLAAMQEVSGLDLTLFKLWYSQAGTPLVSVATKYDEKTAQYKLLLKQTCAPTPDQTEKKPLQIPIAVGLLDPGTGRNMDLQLDGEAKAEQNTKILSFEQASQEFTFINIKKPPVLSILRDFSAPVKIEHTQSDEELAFLIEHDSDEFNQWDAARRLKKNTILQLITQAQASKELKVPALLFASYKSILQNNQINLAVKAELLVLPSSGEMLKYMTVADPEIIYQVKKFLIGAIASTLKSEFFTVYNNCISSKRYLYLAEENAKRYLKNICLQYLLTLNTPEMLQLGLRQFQQADNMTDSIAVLYSINNIDCSQRQEILQDFYHRWNHEALIMDKWLLVQAVSELANTASKVKELMQHEIFTLANPNKVYALIGGFANGNPIRFHALSGEGYQILTDAVVKLDKLNPQVAARIVTPFAEKSNFDQSRQAMIQHHLQNIANSPETSRNLAEIVNKCLQV